MSEVAIAPHDGAQDRGIEAIIMIIMAHREGNEAQTNLQGEIEAGLMSADTAAIDILLHHNSRDETPSVNIAIDDL